MKCIHTCLFALLLLCSYQPSAWAQCASFQSAFPPPLPASYPCMDAILNPSSPTYDPYCCTTAFDEYCIEVLRTACDITTNPCRFERCRATGCAQTPYPFCPNLCPAYNTLNPPPGPNPPNILDGILFEMIYFDGSCCQSSWDALCWSALDSISLLVCNDNDPTTIDGCSSVLGCTHTPIPANPSVRVRTRIMLEGAYVGNGVMRNDLRAQGVLPGHHPFDTAPWNYSGTEAAIASTLPNNMTDWALIELRNPLDYTQIVGRGAGLLLTDGRIVAHNDTSQGVLVSGAMPNTNYYIVVRTRNHLATMSRVPTFLSSYSVYDFTAAANQTYGSNQSKLLETYDPNPVVSGDEVPVYAQYAGDFDSNGRILSTDFSIYRPDASAIRNYKKGDCNYDGKVTYSDYNLFRNNFGTTGLNYVWL